MPYRPRFLNRLFAALAGYYWLPCPRCGEMHGGHEATGVVWDDELQTTGRATGRCCPGSFVKEALA